jgi:cytochrome c-type biogenesis protein CcmH
LLLGSVLGLVAAAQTPPPKALETPGKPTTADPRSLVGAPRGQALAGEALEARTRQVASLLRCPVCQGLSVADSPSSTAQNMKAHVRELLAGGYDQEQILDYFERSYGEFVLLEPARRGVNWLVWIAPGLGLLLGAGVVWLALRAPARTSSPTASADVTTTAAAATGMALPDDPRLASYVLKVRELAYGWSAGERPRSET